MKNLIINLCIISVLLNITAVFAEQKQNQEHTAYPWFKQSFLDLAEDLVEAKEVNKGLILYFYQDGCPYCKKLLNDNFSRPELVKKLRNHYDFIAINMWGDRKLTDFEGEEITEKQLAVKLKVMFTPTMVFFDSKPDMSVYQQFRLNGYYSSEKFHTLLDYLALNKDQSNKQPGIEKSLSFSQYYKQQLRKKSKANSNSQHKRTEIEDFHAIAKKSTSPIILLFEEEDCKECKELDNILENNSNIKQLLNRFIVVRVPIQATQEIIDIQGNKNNYSKWSNELKIQYTPSLIFYDIESAGNNKNESQLKEVFRVESYLKAFHLESVLLYIADKEYNRFPEFQRYIHQRVDIMQQKGVKIELWE